MIKDALTAIETALKPNANISYINEDWGQLDFYERPPVLFPCVLLECEGVDFISTARRSQQGKATITLRVADVKMMQQPNVKVTDDVPRYSFFELLVEINRVIHGMSGNNFSPLTRRTISRARRDDGIREFVITYDFSFADNSAVPPSQTVSVPPVININ